MNFITLEILVRLIPSEEVFWGQSVQIQSLLWTESKLCTIHMSKAPSGVKLLRSLSQAVTRGLTKAGLPHTYTHSTNPSSSRRNLSQQTTNKVMEIPPEDFLTQISCFVGLPRLVMDVGAALGSWMSPPKFLFFRGLEHLTGVLTLDVRAHDPRISA